MDSFPLVVLAIDCFDLSGLNLTEGETCDADAGGGGGLVGHEGLIC